ncbi:MAG: AAA family ATPase, partial [Nitrospinota bacterium]|nr:AAA family ATPase [Nitrospinota bacterium]
IDAARLEAALLGKGIPGASLKERLCALAQTALAGGRATHDQANAIQAAMTEKVLIVTGGPGTGKTTIINAVVRLYDQLGLQVLLGAPTGRAAKRLSEVTQREAVTIHRLLDFSWSTGGFTRNAAQPLLADVVIVDEASMLDISLLAHLLRAVPDPAVFILVGDVDQLPSVGPGNSLRDAIESGAFPVARLREVFRQEKESLIVANAHRVNRGEMPRSGEGSDLDYYFIEEPDPERCADRAVEICRERIPARFGLDPIADVQVIAPMQRGTLGVQNLNARLQEALNPGGGGPAFQRGGKVFRIGDKLMQTRNNYQKKVFNGDIGLISGVDPESRSIRVAYDGELVEYAATELDEVIHAYAVTVHKSQGSEYPAVVVPIHTQHYPMLQRNLIYTAMTRGKRLVVFLGTKKALAIALNNAKVRRRWSHLAERLRREMDLPLPGPGAGTGPLSPRGEAPPDEAPPDAIYEEEVGGEAEGELPGPGELTYHPVED